MCLNPIESSGIGYCGRLRGKTNEFNNKFIKCLLSQINAEALMTGKLVVVVVLVFVSCRCAGATNEMCDESHVIYTPFPPRGNSL